MSRNDLLNDDSGLSFSSEPRVLTKFRRTKGILSSLVHKRYAIKEIRSKYKSIVC